MAKKLGENAKWGIGIFLTALTMVFGSNLYDRYVEPRELTFELRAPQPKSGTAILRIVNLSRKTCGPVRIEFTANAVLKTATIRNGLLNDRTVVSGRSLQIDVARLATGNGRIDVEFQYDDLSGDTLHFTPADAEVGCGDFAYRVVRPRQESADRWSSRWIVMAGLALIAFIAIVVGYFVLDPFRNL